MPAADSIPWWWAPLLSTVLGAISGGIAGLVIGPTKAEREERGKRRIDARRSVARSLQSFRYRLSEYRLAMLAIEADGEFSSVREAALTYAKAVQVDGAILPRRERKRLHKNTRKIIGRTFLRIASLRSPDSANVTADSASLTAIALERQDTSLSLFNESFETLAPTSSDWDKLLSAIDKVRRRYP